MKNIERTIVPIERTKALFSWNRRMEAMIRNKKSATIALNTICTMAGSEPKPMVCIPETESRSETPQS